VHKKIELKNQLSTSMATLMHVWRLIHINGDGHVVTSLSTTCIGPLIFACGPSNFENLKSWHLLAFDKKRLF